MRINGRKNVTPPKTRYMTLSERRANRKSRFRNSPILRTGFLVLRAFTINAAAKTSENP